MLKSFGLCFVFAIVCSVFLTGCSSPIEGLWIEKNEGALLFFRSDSVINNVLNISQFCATFGYRLSKDSLTLVGLDTRYNFGKTTKSFPYLLENDSLHIWYDGKSGIETVYFKSNAMNFHDYFLKRPELTINLPDTVANSRTFGYDPAYILDVVVGFKDDKVAYYFQGVETGLDSISETISRLAPRAIESGYPEIETCRIFADESIPCEYILGLFDYLRANKITNIFFATNTRRPDQFRATFEGLSIRIPIRQITLIEEKDSL